MSVNTSDQVTTYPVTGLCCSKSARLDHTKHTIQLCQRRTLHLIVNFNNDTKTRFMVLILWHFAVAY